MRVMVIGLGSMGKRRIRLIRKYDPAIEIIGIDFKEERRSSCGQEYGIKTFGDISEGFGYGKIESTFICTSPLSHNKIIARCLEYGAHVFTELNLVPDGYEENLELAKKKDRLLFLSSTFLYRDEIKKIKSFVEEDASPLNYIYHIGQYLPDWHPWENYRDFFAGDKRSNGCREIFAIELPWLTETFGEVIEIKTMKDKRSGLEIDYCDNYQVMLRHSSGCKGLLAVDIISRKAVRNLEVFGERLYLSWDGTPTGLYQYDYSEKMNKKIELYREIDQLENYSSFVVENAYMNEIMEFFHLISDGGEQIYGFEKDKKILDLIDRIEA